MTRPTIIISLAAGLCGWAAGWLGAPTTHAGGSLARAETETVSAGESALLRAPSSRPVLYANMKLTAEEEEVLKLTPEEFVAKQETQGGSAQHIARCMEVLQHEPPALCQRIEATMHDFRLANARLLRELFSGTLEVGRYQEGYHRNFLAYQVALEGYLSYDQMMFGYPGVEPGDDPFMVAMGWFFALPPGYKVGEDLLSRGTGEDAPARSPWSFGPSRMEGTRQ